MKKGFNRGSHKVKTAAGSIEKGGKGLPWNGNLKVSGKKTDEIVKNQFVSTETLAGNREEFLNNVIPE
jgi:hypothetical protein